MKKRYLHKQGDMRWLYIAGEKIIISYPREDEVIKSTYNDKTDTTTVIIAIKEVTP